jgi:hypothetical protein
LWEVEIASSELCKEACDGWRTPEDCSPHLVDVSRCDVWIVALDIHLDDGPGSKMPFSMTVNRTLRNSSKQKLRQFDGYQKSLEYLRLDTFEFFLGIVDLAKLGRC